MSAISVKYDGKNTYLVNQRQVRIKRQQITNLNELNTEEEKALQNFIQRRQHLKIQSTYG